jgi:hypothetical protein
VNSSAQGQAIACALFAVTRADGKLRLIWDGRPFNQRCRPPPKIRFSRLEDDVSMLLRSPARSLVAVDLQSWFVQLKPLPDIADKYFGVRRRDGRGATLTGIPMGWAWAPVVAQSVTDILVRRVLAALSGRGLAVVASCSYVDNIVLALPEESEPDSVLAVVREVCASAGAVIKPSSIEMGSTVDWRGLTLDVSRRRLRLKPAFVEKLRTAVERARAHSARPTLSWSEMIPLLSCVIYATYAVGKPLASIVNVMRWVVRLSSTCARVTSPESLNALMRISLTPPAGAWAEIEASVASSEEWYEVCEQVEDAPAAFGQSDAAGSETALSLSAFAFHNSETMRLSVWQPPTLQDIFHREFEAMVRGMTSGNEPCQHRWCWLTDNTRSIYQLRKTWAAEWFVNEAVEHWHALQRRSRSTVAYFPRDLCC